MAITTLIQVRRGLAATWTSVNPILNSGEIGFETDTNQFKIGDGSTVWTSLAYAGGGGISYAATATAAGTTTLVATSKTTQNFTGTSTQTVVLPVVSTLSLGSAFQILNNSTQSLTINSSGGNLIATLQTGFSGLFTVVSTSGTTAASWDYQYSGFDNITGTGNVVFSGSPTISAPTISGHPTIEGVTSTGATGTGNLVFSAAPTISGHPTIEGVTSTGATGTGAIVFGTGPTVSNVTLSGTVTAASSAGSSGQVLTSTGTGVQWATAASDPTPTVFMLMGA